MPWLYTGFIKKCGHVVFRGGNIYTVDSIYNILYLAIGFLYRTMEFCT